MIIRAVSDSDSDDSPSSTIQAASASERSVFHPPDIISMSVKSSATRYTWVAAFGALILLLLVDLAAIFNPSPDIFALLPMLIAIMLYNDSIVLPTTTASVANQFVGLAFVAVWVYSREKSLASGNTSQWLCNTRYGFWMVVALMLLGHVVSCLYLLFALLESDGDCAKFWLGRKYCNRYRTDPYGRV